MCCLRLIYVFIFLFSTGNCLAAYLEIAAHSDYDMFSWYMYISVFLVFSHPSVYRVGISF